MNTTLTLTDLDSIRAETMMALLNAEGRKYIWQYDIQPRSACFAEARHDMNFDALDAALKARDKGKPYALTGPGIEDTYFGTVMELIGSLLWLCRDGYLGCYAVAKGETYANQQAVLIEHKEYPFIPLIVTRQ